MRFMKRKKETQEQEQYQRNVALERSTKTKTSTIQPVSIQNSATVAMDIDSKQYEQGEDANEAQETTRFVSATPSDMYGMQADLFGRRSFGGFHNAMDEAWKESKTALENFGQDTASSSGGKKKYISDEELLQRYEELVQKRSEGSRPIGNLQKKNTRRRGRK